MALQSFDLTELSYKLEKEGGHASLWKAIKRLSSVSSIKRDLLMVEAALRSLSDLDQHGTDKHQPVLGSALLTHAVIVYCRATHTSGDGRWHVGVTNAFDNDQKRTHQDIVDLRDQTIAHFDIGVGRHSARWRSVKVLLKVHDEKGIGVGTSWSETNYSTMVRDELRDLTTTAISYVEELRQRRLDQLLESIDAALEVDPTLQDRIEGYPFDHRAFFGPGFEAEIEAYERGVPSHTNAIAIERS